MKPARIISYILHPALVPLAGVFLLLTFAGWLPTLSNAAKGYLYLVTFFTTLLLPAAVMPFIRKIGLITDYQFANRDNRKIPLLLCAFFYLGGAFFLQKVEAPAIIPLYLNGLSMVALVCALVNWRWKVSLYMAALGGLTGLIIGISLRWMLNLQWIIGILFLLSGIAGFARLKGAHHTPVQVYVGYIIGLTINILLFGLI